MLLISVKRREDTTHKDIAVYLSRLKITKDLANFVSYSSNVNIMQDIVFHFILQQNLRHRSRRQERFVERIVSIDEAVIYTNDTLRITDEYLSEIAV